MTTKHTPAPWIVKAQGEANEFVLMTSNMKWIAAFRQNGEMWTQEQEANAKVIEAAPDLLEALNDLLAWANISDNSSSVYLRDKCLQAIKKATE